MKRLLLLLIAVLFFGSISLVSISDHQQDCNRGGHNEGTYETLYRISTNRRAEDVLPDSKLSAVSVTRTAQYDHDIPEDHEQHQDEGKHYYHARNRVKNDAACTKGRWGTYSSAPHRPGEQMRSYPINSDDDSYEGVFIFTDPYVPGIRNTTKPLDTRETIKDCHAGGDHIRLAGEIRKQDSSVVLGKNNYKQNPMGWGVVRV